VAAAELTRLPLVGRQLVGGKHILIDRTNRRSQLKSFKEALAWLKAGVSVVAVPEGTRSRDGRMVPFKGGVFSMAMKTGVPIVPITLTHTYQCVCRLPAGGRPPQRPRERKKEERPRFSPPLLSLPRSYPPSSLLPIVPNFSGKLALHVHPAIETEGKTEEELQKLTQAAILSRLPAEQHPVEVPEVAAPPKPKPSPPAAEGSSEGDTPPPAAA